LTKDDLVCACLAGDRTAWEALVRRYERLLYSVALRCGLSEDDAADVCQNVFVKLLENLKDLRDQQRIARWLIVTATRESWRVQRLTRRHVAFPAADPETAESEFADLPDSDPLPHEILLRLEEGQLVRECVGELNERCRTLLDLLYYSDPPLSYAEISQQLQMPEGSIGPARARCLRHLRRLLESRGF
jgi:RNA polymerase sigma factor (sigma-70 family)